MSQRANSIAAGLGFYAVLVAAFYAVHRLAFDVAGGPPMWFWAGWPIFDAAKAVVPGAAAGWLCRAGALRSGAIVGGVGGLIEVLTLGVLNVMPLSEFPARMTVGIVVAALMSAFTNAIGAAAGAFWHGARTLDGVARD